MKKCQTCNFENSDTMRFCVECGTPLPDAPIIVNLGGGERQSGVETANYGKSMETQAAGKGSFPNNFPNNFSNVPPPKKTGGKKTFLIIGGIAALLLLIFTAGAAIVAYNVFFKDDIVDRGTPTPTKDSPTPTSTTTPKSPTPTETPDESPTPTDNGEGEAEVDKIRVDYDVTEGGKKGMRVHVTFTVHDLKDTDAYLAIYFEKKNGDKLYTNNKDYRSKDGQVAVFFTIKPAYKDAVYEDTKLFVPYEEFNLDKGKYDLKMDVDVIYKNGDMFKHMQYYDFVYTEG